MTTLGGYPNANVSKQVVLAMRKSGQIFTKPTQELGQSLLWE